MLQSCNEKNTALITELRTSCDAEIDKLTKEHKKKIVQTTTYKRLKKENEAQAAELRKLQREHELAVNFIVSEDSEYRPVNGTALGKTVRTAVAVRPDEDGLKIREFHGEVVYMSHEEALKLRNEYLIYLSKGKYLDCQQTSASGRCVASMVNTPRGLRHKVTGLDAKPNTRLKVTEERVWLVTNGVAVPANGEYFLVYGNGFIIN
jgi:hypothetical protein